MSNESTTSSADQPVPSWAAGGPSGTAALTGDDGDAALVRRCQGGDLGAYGRLVAGHEARVSALIARVLGPRATAEDVADVAQDVFVQAWRALPRFRQDARFSTWLHRIATNMAIKQWHRLKRRGAAEAAEEDLPEGVRAALSDSAPGPADIAARRERDRALRAAVDRLPEKQRTAVLLHYFEGYSCEEVAGLLGCSVGTVWSRLHYACRKLRGAMDWLEEN